ncbi:hypothetical protein TNCV_1188201 [Trichonephila clavipes]|nr:hypothetical protein TNCV_1188201 [Trichonephila clavipes]
MYSAFAAWRYSKQPSSHKFSHEVGGRRRDVGGPHDHPQRTLPEKWGGAEQNRTVTFMVLKAKSSDRRKNLALRRDEFRRP